MGGVFQLFWERGGDSQKLGHCPLFHLYGRPWDCHGACGCHLVCSRSGGSQSSANLDLVGSNQFMSCPRTMSFFFLNFILFIFYTAGSY